MRTRSLLAATLAATALLVSPAEAHEGNPNYRSEVTGLVPNVPGTEAEIVNFDDSLRLRNNTGKKIIVEGYEGEPYVRIQADGTVAINQDSPSFYLNQDRFAESPVPDSADETAPPDWRDANDSGEYAWHDHRIHYMGQGTPAQVKDESERTKIFDYSVPIVVGGQKATIDGTLYWVGEDDGFPVVAFIALGAALSVAGLVVFVTWRRRRVGDEISPETREVW